MVKIYKKPLLLFRKQSVLLMVVPVSLYIIQLSIHILLTALTYGAIHIRTTYFLIICNANYLDHTAPHYLKLYMLQFPDIVKYFTGIYMFKTFLNTLLSSLKDLFTLASSQCLVLVNSSQEDMNIIFSRNMFQVQKNSSQFHTQMYSFVIHLGCA